MFECLEVAHEVIRSIAPHTRVIAKQNPELADQLRRAAISVVSNLDEGAGLTGAQRRHHYRIALGSAREVASQLRVAHSWGYVDDVTKPLALIDRVRAMLWRLTR